MNPFVQLQIMASRQSAILDKFDALKKQMLELAEMIQTTEPKSAQFLADMAVGGLKSVMDHYLLESRGAIREQTEKVSLNDIVSEAEKQAAKEGQIVPIIKLSDFP